MKDNIKNKKQLESLKNSNAFSRGLLKKIARGLVIHDGESGIQSANSYVVNLLNIHFDELYEKELINFVAPEYRDLFKENMNSEDDIEYKIELIHKSGSRIPVRIKNGSIDGHEKSLRYMAIDSLSDLQRYDDTAQQCGIKYRLMIQKSREAIIVINEEGYIDYISDSFEKMTGYSPFEAAGEHFTSFIHPDDREHYSKSFINKIVNGEDISRLEVRLKEKDNSWINAELYPSNMLDESLVNGIILNVRNISELRGAQERAAKFQFYDSDLTNLPTIGLLKNRLQMEIIKSMERGNENIIAVMSIDVDNFVKINNLYGRSNGDKLLNRLAVKLRDHFREDDLLARLSGDTFMVLLSNVARTFDFNNILSKTRAVFSEPFDIDDKEIELTACIGLSIFPDDGQDTDELINNSMSAMYSAKKKGPNNYSLFNPELHDELLNNLQLEEDLKDAIAKKEFVVYYQPKFDRDRKFSGAESLVRWQSPKRGFIPPNEFIPLAEKNGMIVEIGYQVIRTVCEQVKIWSESGFNKKVGINLAPEQFMDPDLVKKVNRILDKTGVNKNLIEFEITESGIMKDEDDALQKMKNLHEIGLEIVMDDFGKGLSSLSNLLLFPINTLKIDKSFIDKIPHNKQALDIVYMIFELSKRLGCKVVAEGIENAEQLEHLLGHECDGLQLQGFYFSKPVPADEFERAFIQMVDK